MLQIEKSAERFVEPGATLVYTITYANTGGSTATGVTITETVPVATTFDAPASTPGWSCADGSPPGTVCVNAVADLPANATAMLQFAVVVDTDPPTLIIANTVVIRDAQGGDSSGGSSTIVGEIEPAPALAPWALAAALVALALVARRRWG